MVRLMSNKYYLIGSKKNGNLIAYSDDKKIAKEFIDTYKGYSYVTLDMDDIEENIKPPWELELIYLGNSRGDIITNDDELFLYEAFKQYRQELSYCYLSSLIEDIKYLKFSDNEKPFIEYLVDFLTDFCESETTGAYDEIDIFDIYNYDRVISYFVDDIIGRKRKDEKK